MRDTWQAVLEDRALCSAAPIWSHKLHRMYPSLFFAREQAEQFELGDLLVSGVGCEGVLMARQDYLSLRGDVDYCTLQACTLLTSQFLLAASHLWAAARCRSPRWSSLPTAPG